jgi:hypothetical protein
MLAADSVATRKSPKVRAGLQETHKRKGSLLEKKKAGLKPGR